MFKDKFKRVANNQMAIWDMNCPDIYSLKWRGKMKKIIRRIARRKVKGDLDNENEV